MDVNTFYMYLFLNWFTMLVSAAVSDDQKYVCGCRLYACINTRKFKGPWFQRNYIIARDQNLFTWHVISIIACSSQGAFAYNESFHFLSLIFGWGPRVYYLWISGETLIKRSIYLQLYLSAKSLQIILNKLESFCENADLSVNLDKTKIMIFNNCGKSLNNYSSGSEIAPSWSPMRLKM